MLEIAANPGDALQLITDNNNSKEIVEKNESTPTITINDIDKLFVTNATLGMSLLILLIQILIFN